jgi:PAS domain S-box-containing protein
VAILVYKTINNEGAHRRFRNTAQKMRDELAVLNQLSAADPHEHEVMQRVGNIIERNTERGKDIAGITQESSRLLAAHAIISMQRDLDELASLLQNTLDEQADVQAEKKQVLAHYRILVASVLGIGLFFNILLAVILAIYFNRGTSKRLASLMENIWLLGKERSLTPPLSGEDEIAELDKVFRSMSDTLTVARHRERAIVENALAVICSINPKGNVIQINPASKILWDLEPSELIGNPIKRIVCESDRERTTKFFERLISEKTSGTLENRILRGDNALADVQWTVQWSETEKSLFCVGHDITREKELERIKQQFVAMVSHDLGAPLMSVQIILELLASGQFGQINPEGQNRLSFAEEEIGRLIRMIKDLLDIERLESGMTKFDSKPTPVDQILRSAYDVLSTLAEKNGIELEIAEHENFVVSCEADRIVQVLLNLVANSVKFSPSHSTITIDFRADGNYVKVVVIDQGRGVPKEMRETIFDRFRQVEKDDARVKGGTGLGLAICKTIVEQHGGRIGVESPNGRGGDGKKTSSGSVFWFTLPRAM